MQPRPHDAAHLWDMLDAAKSAVRFVADKTLKEFLADEVLQAALERKIEIIGEAARRVSQDFKDSHQAVPWRRIIAQRNVIIHEYGEIDQNLIWNVTKENLPELISILERLVPPSPKA
jgi:uncharacterized protein with HEPN domain